MRRYVYLLLGCCALLSIGCDDNKETHEVDKDPVETPPAEDPTDTTVVTPDIPVITWETAREAVDNMQIGWNLGNTLDAHEYGKGEPDNWRKWETYWGQPVTTRELFQMMKKAGFNAIRVPVTWYLHMDETGKVYDAWMNRVREIVDYVIDTDMYCIVNVHHDTGDGEKVWLLADMDVYNREKAKYEYLWTQIAETFKEYDHRLLFESYNEMLDSRRSWCFSSFVGDYDAEYANNAYKAINCYAQSFVNAVRATGGNNAVRNLVVNTYGACCGLGTWNSHLTDPITAMALPADNVQNHLIVEIHSYIDVKDINNAKSDVDEVVDKVDTHLAKRLGVPVIFGEWGSVSSDGESDYYVRRDNLIEYYEYFVTKNKERGIGTFLWMGLSDGIYRSIPVFSEPELAEAILKAYHGASYEPQLSLIEDYELSYNIVYNSIWSEAHLIEHSIDLDVYKAIRVEMSDVSITGTLQMKGYLDNESGEYYFGEIGQNVSTITFDKEKLGNKIKSLTLQCFSDKTVEVSNVKSTLIKHDGTEEEMTIKVFWGCDVILDVKSRKE